MAVVVVPVGFVVKYSSGKPGIVKGMYWKVDEEKTLFWCYECSLNELRLMEPPLTKIEKDWDAIREELFHKRGCQVPIYDPKTPIKCDKCGLIIPNTLGDS
ncbi:MAG: hypothetical protein FJ130_04115 [Deltaproteobacteria bacterium]|nr:hypothetical protein [Deltaproteobacteria bacterium]